VAAKVAGSRRKARPWNGRDFYVNFGDGDTRAWEDGRKYGFVGGGQGLWFSRTLKQLIPGSRVFAYVPQHGYVGVGTVVSSAVMARDFSVDRGGVSTPLFDLSLHADMRANCDDPEKAEWVVGIDWVKTVPIEGAVFESGLFANTNTACRLTDQHTIDRVTKAFGIEESTDLEGID